MIQLTKAEHRVLQMLLHLKNPVSLKLLALGAAHDHDQPSKDNARQVVYRLKRKRPRLGIVTVHGKGYAIEPGRECRHCRMGRAKVAGRCASCHKVYRLGYAAGHQTGLRAARNDQDGLLVPMVGASLLSAAPASAALSEHLGAVCLPTPPISRHLPD